MSDRHYVRFARALALAGTLMGAPGCAASTAPADSGGDDGSAVTDAGGDAGSILVDAAPLIDAFVDCTACQCPTAGADAGLPACPPGRCCPVLGPLAPPDLPALA